MRINSIGLVNSNHLHRNNKVKNNINEQTAAANPNFKGDKGRGIGSVLGFLGGSALVTAVSAVVALPATAAIAAIAVATKLGGDAGDKTENNGK